MPQSLAVGLSVQQSCRGKKVVDLLHGFNVCADYDRLFQVETQIANTLIERMIENEGIYMPQDFVNRRFIFFAIDNSDFAEDTQMGRIHCMLQLWQCINANIQKMKHHLRIG